MPKRCLTSFLALRGFLPASGFWLGALSQIPPCAYRYTLLVGKPPFETSCLKETYLRIKNNEYSIPKVTKTTLSLHLFYLIPSPTIQNFLELCMYHDYFISTQKFATLCLEYCLS